MSRPSFEDLDHPGYSNNPDALRVFFDTEFTGLIVDPKLISIGCIDEIGRTFYAEISDTWTPSAVTDFARAAVLPKLEGGQARMTMSELTVALGNWLESFNVPVQLATDSLSWDWPWIQEIFDPLSSTWPKNLDGKPVVLMQDLVFNLAVEDAFAKGLRRHHALDDAKANRLGWIAAGGDVEKKIS